MEKLVTFPGFGWELSLNPIAISITDGFNVHWYGVIIAVGFLLAVVYCCRQSARFGIKTDDIYDMLIFAVPLAIVGARLYYVIFEWDNYYVPGDPGATFIKIIRIMDGGLAIYGGIIVAVLTAFIVCKVKKISFLALADIGGMGLLIGQAAGRWGNFMNVEAFGGVTDVAWRMGGPEVAGYLYRTGQITQEVSGQIISGELGVHPTFFYESMWNVIGFILIAFVLKNHRKFDGQLFLSYIAWYGIGRFWIEGLRTDSLFIPGTSLRVSQLIALSSALIAVAIILYMLLIKKPGPEKLYVNVLKEAQKEDGTENS